MAFEFEDVFSPFMIGSISLIAFLSVRSSHLATRTRDLCDKIKELHAEIKKADNSEKPDICLEQYGNIVQLCIFMRRYKVSDNALLLAIAFASLFGTTIAAYAFSSVAGSNINLPSKYDCFYYIIAVMLGVGCLAAAGATVPSIMEARIGRRSLAIRFVTTMVTTKYDTTFLSTSNKETVIKHSASIRRHNPKLYEKLLEADKDKNNILRKQSSQRYSKSVSPRIVLLLGVLLLIWLVSVRISERNN